VTVEHEFETLDLQLELERASKKEVVKHPVVPVGRSKKELPTLLTTNVEILQRSKNKKKAVRGSYTN
jgi:hypothetical protein